MYKMSSVLRAARDLAYKNTIITKGSVLTDAQVLGMKTLQSLVAKRWVVPVQDPNLRRLQTARSQSAGGIFNSGVLNTTALTDSSSNNSVKYIPTPTYLNPQTIISYALDNLPYALTGTVTGQASGSVKIDWFAPVNSPSGLTDYSIQYKLSSATSWSTFAHTASTAVTAVVTGLTAGSNYDFQVAAVISAATGSYSNIFTTTCK